MSLILIVRHRVADYAAWRPLFDAGVGAQQAAGMTGAEVYRSADDGNLVLLRWRIADRTRAEAFLASPQLRERMEAASVLGAPEIFFQPAPTGRPGGCCP